MVDTTECEGAVETKRIQELIDAEKPAFDFARMLLTTIALWSVLIFIATTIYAKETPPLMWIAAPVWFIWALFGGFLGVRLNILSERISSELIDGAAGFPVWLRWPFRIIASLMPVASAWLVVWALMFANLSK